MQVLIDSTNTLTIGLWQKDKDYPFRYLVQYALVDPNLVAEPHVKADNVDNHAKGEAVYTRPDLGGTPLLRGFSFTFKKHEAGSEQDMHGLANFGFDLNSGEVQFNDGDADDYFEYILTYATLF